MAYPDVNLPTPYPKGYLETMYDYVIEHKPKTIVEFGSGWGSTTIYMKKAQDYIPGSWIKKSFRVHQKTLVLGVS
jgi:cephalosporin hydroxylase